MSALSSGTGAGWASTCPPPPSAACRTGSWEKKMRTWSPARPPACPCRSKAYMSTGTRCTTTARPPPHRNNLKPWDGFLWSLCLFLTHSFSRPRLNMLGWNATNRQEWFKEDSQLLKGGNASLKSITSRTLVHHDQCRYQTFQKCECQTFLYFFF